MLFDCHMHTHLCGHAQGRPEDYVAHAAENRIELITFTCHIPIEGQGFLQEGIRMNHSQLPRYRELVDRAKSLGQTLGVEVLYGIEAEIFPVEERLTSMRSLLAEEPFDFVLGSLHHQLPIFRKWLFDKSYLSDKEIIKSYFESLTRGIETGFYHSLAHPDVIRIYGTVNRFEPEDYKPEIMAFLEALSENDVCMEVNTSGLAKGVYKLHPDPLILKWAQSMNVNLTIGSDSHQPDQVGRFFPETIELLQETGFRYLCYFKAGKRHEVPIKVISKPY
jgi:histidinol-phosphatase (PHP family)